MEANPEQVGNLILGIGTLLVVAEVLSSAVVAPLVLIGKTISSMTQGKKKDKYVGPVEDTENIAIPSTDDTGSEV